MPRRLAIIRDEHRSLAAVIHGLEYLVREARDAGKPPQFPLLHAMLHYIKAFPEKLHHPKEDAYLFRKLRAAHGGVQRRRSTSSSASTSTGHELVAELERALDALRGGSRRRLRAVRRSRQALRDGAMAAHEPRDQGDHARRAEAPDRRGLGGDRHRRSPSNGDPRFSVDADEEFRQLFARILNLAPENVIGGTARA